MKKSFFYFMLATGALLISLASCKKEDPTPEPEPEPEPAVISCKCEHSDLEEKTKVSPTALTPGIIHHWHCNDCNRNFLDANATIQVRSPYLPATNKDIDTAILNKIQHIFPFGPNFKKPSTKAGGISPAAPIKATFGLLGAISNFKFRQTQKQFMKETMESLNEIQDCLDNMSEEIFAVQTQISTILSYLQGASYLVKITEIEENEQLMWEESLKSYLIVKKLYTDYNAGKISEDQLKTQICIACREWKGDNDRKDYNLYSITTRVLKEFSGGAFVEAGKATYPKIFHEYTNNYRYWEHQGYTDRMQWDMNSIASLSMAYFMASLYREYVAKYDDDLYRRADSIALNYRLGQLDSLVQVDTTNMRLASSAYRRFHSYNYDIILDPVAVVVNGDVIDGKYDSYNVRFTASSSADGNQTPDGINELNRCWDDVYGTAYQDGPTVEDFTTIFRSEPKKSIYDILANTAKIQNMPSAHCASFLRYNPVKLSGLSVDYKKYNNGETRYLIKYNEYVIFATGPSGSKNMEKVVSYLAQYLTDDCVCGEGYCSLLENYSYYNSSIHNSSLIDGNTYRVNGRTSMYTPAQNHQVFVKKYTGKVYDE